MWSRYSKRLARDLDRWQANGWITDSSRTVILADVAKNNREFSLAGALAVLASVLFGFAAISFVAAHWADVPRLARLGLLLASIWAGYGVAGVFAGRDQPAFADAAVLFSSAMFGASIMLISQMYHLDGHAPDAVLLWWVAALFAGVLLRSDPTLGFAMVLVCVWSGMETTSRSFVGVHWPFLIGWLAVTAAFIWQRWYPGLHLSALALSGFVVSLGFLLSAHGENAIVAIIGIAASIAVIAVEKLRPDMAPAAGAVLGYPIAVAFTGLFALQFWESPTLSMLITLAIVTLVLLLGAIAYGVQTGNRGVLWVGYIGFSLEILSLYWRTVGSILGTSLFFLIAAVIVAALAFLALRLVRSVRPSEVAA
ncbi:DUF2157 domain-containing protein [Hyphomicrobium methylovorum]|uniref:DUF2157 domain-containing protein n=1 Tax=Hyphomicrobium methylovorum TaxID=84 RepID=UPI0015E68A3C|nr:DUF2157 domain-containing protein [Hyphomicrobium methylovorum]MBA2127548.1 DUF2157 domain-containing protein [Hyphomicrobium methylovorum]